MPHPSAEDFAQWRENPVTQWVCSALHKAADENKEAWIELSWGQRQLDPIELSDLRVRADAYRAMADTTYEDWLDWMNDGEPSE